MLYLGSSRYLDSLGKLFNWSSYPRSPFFAVVYEMSIYQSFRAWPKADGKRKRGGGGSKKKEFSSFLKATHMDDLI